MDAFAGFESRASVEMSPNLAHELRVSHLYTMECRDARGNLKWTESFKNLVPTEGRNKYLDACLKTGLASPAWYAFLKGNGSVAAADTLASHVGWSEITPYSGNRPAWTPGTISSGSVDNSASKAQFTINASTTVYGAGLASVNTGTSGTLLGVGDFTTPRSVDIGDVVSLVITCTMAG